MSAQGRVLLGSLLLVALAASPASAQLQLPGAVNGGGGAPSSGGGGGHSAAEAGPPPPPKPVAVKAPGEEAIAGRVLVQDGTHGAMTFDKTPDGLALSKLVLDGDRISAPTKACTLNVAIATPIAARASGRPSGAVHYQVPLPSCPFEIDVLEGAALVSAATPACAFAAADCRVTLAGLWGPTPAEINDKRAKELERERVRIETIMRTDFRVLLKRAGKDRDAVKAIAAEQAGFSSAREMACRDYAQESVHGFCSTEMTMARVLSLLAKFGDDAGREPEPRRHAAHEHSKPRAAPSTVAAPAAPAPAR